MDAEILINELKCLKRFRMRIDRSEFSTNSLCVEPEEDALGDYVLWSHIVEAVESAKTKNISKLIG